MKKLFLPLWTGGAALLFLYSYTQVDLSLTLSKASIFQDIQKAFQYIGWFDRPLSSFIYILVFAILFGFYIVSLYLIRKNHIKRKTLWITILSITGILTLSYNAFSYDLFNYIFDAKIVTFYNSNPYFHKALDFPNDPMLSFMHWTHRTYPYGPFWLILTVPVSYIGGQIFIITFFLFKILIALFFLLTCWSLEKIAGILKMKNSLLPVAVFALNPFVLTESLVSSHNDIVMMGFFMAGFVYVLSEKNVKGWVFILLSIATKFATLLPAILYVLLKFIKREKLFIKLSIIAMIVAVIAAAHRTTYQPWYLLYILPFAALEVRNRYILLPIIILSIGGILFYLPHLYFGGWEDSVVRAHDAILVSSFVLSIITAIIFIVKDGRYEKK